MKLLPLAVLAMLAVTLAGCAIPQCSTPDGKHKWGKWTNAWSGENVNGYMKQIKICDECGVRFSRITW